MIRFNDRKVACDKCTFEQNVPGNTQVYVCCMCNAMNQCFPLYGLFICGRCKTNVCYPYGTSEFIKCTKCSTVNRVPIEPQKKYKNEEVKKEEMKVEEVKNQKREDDFQIYEEELDFNDVPNKKKDEKVDYPDIE